MHENDVLKKMISLDEGMYGRLSIIIALEFFAVCNDERI